MAVSNIFAAEELRKHYDNPQFSDITISFADERIHAHKNLLSMASGKFRRILSQHANSSELRLENEEEYAAETIEYMLRYIYGLDPENEFRCGHGEFIWMFEIASEYEIPGLRDWAVEKMQEVLEECLEERVGWFAMWVGRIYLKADRHGGELRRLADRMCEENIGELIGDRKFKGLLEEVPELAVKMVECLVGKNKGRAA